MIKVLHYLNQFFAGIGGEDKAGQEVLFLPQPVGVGAELAKGLQKHGVDYATLVCGDNSAPSPMGYFALSVAF